MTKVEELFVQERKGDPCDLLPKSGKNPKTQYACPPSSNARDSLERIIIGMRVELLTRTKYGKKGNHGTVYHFDEHYVHTALENEKCTTKREPQNVRYV